MSNLLNQLTRNTDVSPYRKEKILQFGEGNFLRAFFDWQVDVLNEHTTFDSGVVIVRPIDAGHPKLDQQDGLYTAIIRGIDEKGETVNEPRLITSVNREILAYGEYDKFLELADSPDLEWIVSNTTEAGICVLKDDQQTDFPPRSFPAKLTQFLFRRFNTFNGAEDKGLVLLPCELIDYNGECLKESILEYIALWNLGDSFKTWLLTSNTFCSTLVDRIVTGYPRDEADQLEVDLGYKDKFLVAAEYFYLFVIQGPEWLNKKLCLDQYPLNIRIVDDIKPFKQRKVGILNGAHTAMVPVAYLSGFNTVRDSIGDPVIGGFVDSLLDEEVIPCLDMDQSELVEFKDSVLNRFRNPFIQHQLLSISLNSLTKFKTRLLPQLRCYVEKTGNAPKRLCFSLAALYCFYLGDRNGEVIPLTDDAELLKFFEKSRVSSVTTAEHVVEFLQLVDHWEFDIASLSGVSALVVEYVKSIKAQGVCEALKQI